MAEGYSLQSKEEVGRQSSGKLEVGRLHSSSGAGESMVFQGREDSSVVGPLHLSYAQSSLPSPLPPCLGKGHQPHTRPQRRREEFGTGLIKMSDENRVCADIHIQKQLSFAIC